MFLSVFDLYKIGIGPSSSHTMGPMTAAARFLAELKDGRWPRPHDAVVARLRVCLHGSLAFTGVGHATDRAVVLGLCGFVPASVDPDRVDAIVAEVAAKGAVQPEGHPPYAFEPARDLVFDRKHPLPGHANGMSFEALTRDGQMLLRRVYYSVGGGFVVDEDELQRQQSGAVPAAGEGESVPYPFASAAEMLAMADRTGMSIADMQRANELAFTSARELDERLDAVAGAMADCIRRGLRQEGVMPGGLGVRRRAKAIHDRLQADAARNVFQPLMANDWLSVYAMAVNEENACGGRVVTAPTNGAAGVVPAVMAYFRHFHAEAGRAHMRTFLLTSAAVGGLIKRNASISGAEVGCQGEVGSASAMAAAGLASLMGGSPAQIENAAEIALEHHLGMTCDPVGGLVQVPCIERNAFGAVKAVTAASLAMKGEGSHFMPLDNCIETMRQTGRDMDHRYKETSLGGLAVNLPEC
ncbi:L-serine ammonia-lyase [Aureimonas leprariae]|uniref:L-serine dehydratase n=1 Tax=Plantimonas leprariae TaxID=2615207 RepID=A0A7V7PK40_9HYPH|nr:L-serine ammonia-lyase [Aureimonas leprariae]KAB0675999.1 L-serine ammonia-lyase [Aureimonas leprariae]